MLTQTCVTTRLRAAGVVALWASTLAVNVRAAQIVDARPNVVMIVVDDLRWDEIGAMGHPYLETPNIDRLAREGAMFLNAYNVTPLCSPDRASILTGQYPSRHGITDNADRSVASHYLKTFVQDLHAAGYETAHVGKWHMGNDPTPRPGYDYWVSFPGQGHTIDPELYEDGRLHKVTGYVTDLLTDRAEAFIRRPRNRPFFLYVGEKAIHPEVTQRADGSIDLSTPNAYIPAPRHAGRYEQKVFPRRPNAVAPDADQPGKPVLNEALRRKRSPEIVQQFGRVLDPGTSEETIRRRSEMLLAVDEGLGKIVGALAEQGQLDKTVIIFTSDNGFFYGEHGLSLERRLPYEEGIREPLLVRYPPIVKAGARPAALAIAIDLAPTVLELAAVPIPDRIQGRSLVPVLRGDTTGWRRSFLVEYFSTDAPMPWLADVEYRAVRMGKYKYIRWIRYDGMDELYDLEADPYEMENVVARPDMKPVVVEARAVLSRLVLEAMGLSH